MRVLIDCQVKTFKEQIKDKDNELIPVVPFKTTRQQATIPQMQEKIKEKPQRKEKPVKVVIKEGLFGGDNNPEDVLC